MAKRSTVWPWPRYDTRMKSRPKYFVIVIGLLCAGVFVRFWYVASTRETGRETLERQWHAATLGWLGLKYRALDELRPDEQADYWLRQLPRVVARNPNSAQVHMGAALILNQPAHNHYLNYLSRDKKGRRQYDSMANQRDSKDFELRCTNLCLEYAKRATELEPDQPVWWRLRVGLHLATADRPRNEDWQAVVAQARKHDPDNALYDFLLAGRLLDQGSDWVLENVTHVFKIVDEERFQEGLDYIEKANSLPLRGFERAARPAIESVLKPLDLHAMVRDNITSSCHLLDDDQIYALASSIARYHYQQSRSYREQGQSQNAIDSMRKAVACCRRRVSSDETNFHVGLAESRAAYYANELVALPQDDSEFALLDLDAIEKSVREGRTHYELTMAMHHEARAYARGFDMYEKIYQPTLANHVTTLVCPRLSVVLMMLALLALLVLRIAGGRKMPRRPGLGIWRPALVWSLCFGGSFAVFGLAPAGVIGETAQAWAALILATVGVFCFLVLFTRKMFKLVRKGFGGEPLSRQQRLQIVARLALWSLVVIVPVALMVPFWLLANWTGLKYQFTELSRPIHMSPIALKPPLAYGEAYGPPVEATVDGAAMQWLLYQGPYIAAMLAIVVLLIWQIIRMWSERNDEEARGWRKGLAHLARSMSRSMLAVAALLIVVYLLAAPIAIDRFEKIRRELSLIRFRPQEQLDKELAIVARIKADAEAMQAIKEKVESEFPSVLLNR